MDFMDPHDKQPYIDRSDARVTSPTVSLLYLLDSMQWRASARCLSAFSVDSACSPLLQWNTQMAENNDRKPGNYLSIGALPFHIASHTILTVFSLDGGHSGLPALYIEEETFSRLQYDLNSADEIRPCDHRDLIMGSGLGACVQ